MAEWIRVADRMPEPGAYVLAYYRNSYGKGRRIRAMYAAKFTLEQSPEGELGGAEDYDEATDRYYVPIGWYECNEHEEVNWRVDEGEVSHWMPLPDPPEADQ